MKSEMEHTKTSMTRERILLETLKKCLVNIGVPERSILLEPILRFPNGEKMHADLVVMTADGTTVIAQFEVKHSSRGKTIVFEVGRHQMHEAMKWHRCFVVTASQDAFIVADARYPKAQWIDILQLTELKQLFGDYEINSILAVEDRKNRNSVYQKNITRQFAIGVAIVGLITVGTAGWLEYTHHHVFSRRLYGLLCYILALLAAGSGFYIKANIGNFGVTVYNPDNLLKDGASKTKGK